MKTITWSERFSVGVKEIDLQHRELLDIINKIIESIENKKEWHTTSTILNSLINYAYNHFATEERLMQKADYPDLLRHVDLHLEFIRKVFQLEQEVLLKGTEVQHEIFQFLVGWYSNHVLVVDREYMGSMAAKGIK
ncbi:MAG: hemerythrin family protein [Bacteroidales bacterium]|nr:hemerythrin family protein [Bacteroidales bacterium]